MGRILKEVERFYNAADIKYQRVPDRTVLVMSMTGKSAAYEVYAIENEQQEQLSFYAVCPNRVPEESRGKIAEFITRANYGLKNGNFEMDYSDGEVRYKTFIDIEGGTLTPKMIENLLFANIATVDRYYPGIAKVLYADVSPEAAVEQIEG